MICVLVTYTIHEQICSQYILVKQNISIENESLFCIEEGRKLERLELLPKACSLEGDRTQILPLKYTGIPA